MIITISSLIVASKDRSSPFISVSFNVSNSSILRFVIWLLSKCLTGSLKVTVILLSTGILISL